MRRSYFTFVLSISCLTTLLTSCRHSSGSTWEDTKTLGHYIQRGSKLLFKQDPNSKLIGDAHEFNGPADGDFIPLNINEISPVLSRFSQDDIESNQVIPSALETNTPAINAFKKPSNELSSIFKIVHFNTDEHALKDPHDLTTLKNIANYMKQHKDLYLFVLGHCDERGSEAYNLALATKRASYVRTSLVNHGVDANHVLTISFGKELPIDLGHSQEAWSKNRRAEFKIYEKSSTIMK
jgi:peptidoglycan-associated lipoprotein